jgi:pimeloyl-ACP methyl ester carboxylesterase
MKRRSSHGLVTGFDSMLVSGIDESEFSRVQVGDVELAYCEAGPSADAQPGTVRPPLVLVHGFTGHRDDWIEVLPDLARTRRTIAFDLRGHGDSDATRSTSEYSFANLVKDLLGLLDALGIERCDLLGHSVGGMVVLRFALAHPERIRSLILMNTAPEVPEALSRDAWCKASEIAETRGMGFLQDLSERMGRLEADPDLLIWGERYWLHQRRRMRAMCPESYRGVGGALFDSASLVPRLREIQIRTLVLVGEGDHEFLPGAALLETHLPNAARVTIAKSGHHPHQENKAAWLEAIENFTRGRDESGDD